MSDGFFCTHDGPFGRYEVVTLEGPRGIDITLVRTEGSMTNAVFEDGWFMPGKEQLAGILQHPVPPPPPPSVWLYFEHGEWDIVRTCVTSTDVKYERVVERTPEEELRDAAKVLHDAGWALINPGMVAWYVLWNPAPDPLKPSTESYNALVIDREFRYAYDHRPVPPLHTTMHDPAPDTEEGDD